MLVCLEEGVCIRYACYYHPTQKHTLCLRAWMYILLEILENQGRSACLLCKRPLLLYVLLLFKLSKVWDGSEEKQTSRITPGI
jgi:hypothetical protein